MNKSQLIFEGDVIDHNYVDSVKSSIHSKMKDPHQLQFSPDGRLTRDEMYNTDRVIIIPPMNGYKVDASGSGKFEEDVRHLINLRLKTSLYHDLGILFTHWNAKKCELELHPAIIANAVTLKSAHMVMIPKSYEYIEESNKIVDDISELKSTIESQWFI